MKYVYEQQKTKKRGKLNMLNKVVAKLATHCTMVN